MTNATSVAIFSEQEKQEFLHEVALFVSTFVDELHEFKNELPRQVFPSNQALQHTNEIIAYLFQVSIQFI